MHVITTNDWQVTSLIIYKSILMMDNVSNKSFYNDHDCKSKVSQYNVTHCEM